MYYTCKPTKIQIYINNKYKNSTKTPSEIISQIKSETGCDVILNGGLYDISSWQPVCHLRVNNIQYSSDPYQYMGYGWDLANINYMASKDENRVKNFICCVALVENSQPISKLIYNSDIGGMRGRTAIGRKSDGTLLIYCVKDNSSEALTPEQLRTKMYELGCQDAIMLDGGKSSQCITPNGNVNGNRIVQNYICIWTSAPKIECPYQEPTFNIKLGSMGVSAKWVQWYLNANGANLTVDGIFGAASIKALKEFQTKYKIVVDGICGSITRTLLKEHAIIQEQTTSIIEAPSITINNCPYSEPTKNLSYGAKKEEVKWLQWHLYKCGYNIAIDGDFGPSTRSALINFQSVNKLSVDGICGKQTRETLKSIITHNDSGGYNSYIQTLIIKRNQMLDYIEKRVGDIYVYGSQGEAAGDTIINWSARCFPSYTTLMRADRMKQYIQTHPKNACGEPIKAHDCSGLFWAAENLVELPLVDGKDIDDSTAAGLYQTYCIPISKSQLQPLDLVFNPGLTHVAIVGRGGKIYEAAGSDIGVVCNNSVDDRIVKSIYGPAYGCAERYQKEAWTKFGRLKIYAEAGI